MPGPTSSRLLILCVCLLALFEACRNIYTALELDNAWTVMHDAVAFPEIETHKNKEAVVIGYAVSITQFTTLAQNKGREKLLDRAAVLAKSIQLAMDQSRLYDYHLFAFVHPNATECIPRIKSLGYRVQVRDTPFRLADIKNQDLLDAQGNGCCDEREYLKLYSYLLLEYPVVVHLDLDSIVLRPMEDVFNLMTGRIRTTEAKERFAQTATMWLNPTTTASTNTTNNNHHHHHHHNNGDDADTATTLTQSIPWASVLQSTSTSASILSNNILQNPERINFLFTRDYNMVDPPLKKVYQMGVQGGFLVVRPNQRDFDRMVDIIVSGGHNYDAGDGWGGKNLAYGGYYGAGTIQGLSSFYYDYYENATRSVELNRCVYNTMVDDRYHFDTKHNKTLCRTTEEACQNCQETELDQIYTAHFTVCGKPEWCQLEQGRLCMELFHEWHKVRLALEMDWMERFERYVPKLNGVDPDISKRNVLESKLLGHCDGDKYIPLIFPNSNMTLI